MLRFINSSRCFFFVKQYKSGAHDQDRTGDLHLTKVTLYLLSYMGTKGYPLIIITVIAYLFYYDIKDMSITILLFTLVL